jgi:sugar lactone lactonase YvrE
MNPGELDKEVYRSIIRQYFEAFGTRDFSHVQFSSQVKFLSPISGTTMDGRLAVSNFVSGVSTRVKKVEVLYICVDFPNASGVWKMTTTHDVVYTLHNFFKLDGEGLVYIWPMFDPKAVMDDPAELLRWLTGRGYFPVAARIPQQVAGVTVSQTGRVFVNVPRWVDQPSPSVAEIAADGSLIPYPNAKLNEWDKQPGESARSHFVSIQSVVADEQDALWILDPASPNFEGVIEGGPKLLKVNLATDEAERVYHFDSAAAPTKSYLNDVRFAAGHAFMSDSGLGAIVVLDLETGKVRRLLEDHPSTKAEAGLEPIIGGRPWKFADGTTPQVHSDGIAIDPELEYVYYKALLGRTLYRVPVAALLDEKLSSAALGQLVETVAVTDVSDGLEFDAAGNLYLTALEHDAIKVYRRDRTYETFATARDFTWPDTITITRDGQMYFSASQFHLMPAFNQGQDKRTPPYSIFRLSLNEPTR